MSLSSVTVLYEIIGCSLPWLWPKQGVIAWLLIPVGVLLTVLVWLLTLHPATSGRVYIAYDGVYVVTVLLWLCIVDGVKLSLYDWSGALVALCGMLITMAGRGHAWRLSCNQTAFF